MNEKLTDHWRGAAARRVWSTFSKSETLDVMKGQDAPNVTALRNLLRASQHAVVLEEFWILLDYQKGRRTLAEAVTRLIKQEVEAVIADTKVSGPTAGTDGDPRLQVASMVLGNIVRLHRALQEK
jgi:hypothetical protein